MGLVRGRTDQVVSTALTRKHPAVYEIFCRWLREHQPAIFEHPFPSTSISVNHGYAARKSLPESKQPLPPSREERFGNSEFCADRSPRSELTVTQIDLSCLSGGGSGSAYFPAARKHRDAYNAGPSMTKAFGLFEGGRLLYWPLVHPPNPIGDASVR